MYGLMMFQWWEVDNKDILRNICFQRIHGIKQKEIQDYQLVYHSKTNQQP